MRQIFRNKLNNYFPIYMCISFIVINSRHLTNVVNADSKLSWLNFEPPNSSKISFSTDFNSTLTIPKSSSVLNRVDKLFKRDSTKTVDERETDPGEILRKALINHTLTHGGEEDLDKIIFSSLPEGSKLVVQSVKVIPTDENGDPIEKYIEESPIHWDVSLINATNSQNDNYDESEEETEGREGETEIPEGRNSSSNTSNSNGKDDSHDANDLLIAGSHSKENYKTYGNSLKDKEQTKKYYHGNDHGKTHKVTNTDTDGLKLTKYHGKEDGVKDYANAHGKKQSNEGERFRDTKKKNKGRRVSGFKRVYHKEEFQRTEHFYDDEDAKRIAESFGQKNAKDHKEHGIKDDDRKYHGTRNEHTDGNKVKNEHGTSNGYNKGQLTEYKDSEKHAHGSHYDKSRHSPREQQNYYHPNHNYHGSYSNLKKNTIRRPNTPNSFNHAAGIGFSNGIIGVVSKAPLMAEFTVTEPHHPDSFSDSSTDVPKSSVKDNHASSFMNPNNHKRTFTHSRNKPDEIKIFYSPREHPSVSSNNMESYAPNYHPPSYGTRHPTNQHRNPHNRPRYFGSPFHNKIGNASLEEDGNLSRQNYTNYYRNNNNITYEGERYARNFPTSTSSNTLFGPHKEGYSTMVKVLPVKYINLTDGDESQINNGSRQQTANHPQLIASPIRNFNTRNRMNVKDITFTTPIPAIYRRPPGSRWISISFGDPDLIDGNPNKFNHPSHNNGYNNPIRPPLHEDQNQFIRPLLKPLLFHRPRPPPPHYPNHLNSQENRFDHSKYPPNVIQAMPDSIQNFIVKHNDYSVNETTDSSKNYPRNNKPQGISSLSSETQSIGNNFRSPSASFPNGNSHPTRQRAPHSLPPFMNNLMDSVANFFSNVG